MPIMAASAFTITSPPWITVNGGSGSGNGSFTIRAAANTLAFPRTGTVNVSGTGITRVVSVSQAAAPANLQVYDNDDKGNNPAPIRSYGAPAAGGTLVVRVASNSVWSANTISTSHWVTVIEGSGILNGSFAVVADPNPTGNQRTATVRVSANGVSQPINITVTQAGAPLPKPTSPANAGWVMPNSDLTYITALYGYYPDSTVRHFGLDMVKPVELRPTEGTPLYPVYDGKVYRTTYNLDIKGYSIIYKLNQLHWSTGVQPSITYMHLKEYPPTTNPNLYVGSPVYKGQTLLGLVGESGLTPGNVHLHFEITKTDNVLKQSFEDTENPLPYCPGVTFTGEAATKARSGSGAVESFESNMDTQSALPREIYLIDSSLIDTVGIESFEAWLDDTVRANENHTYTVIDFLDSFDISLQVYETLMLENETINPDAIRQIVEYAEHIDVQRDYEVTSISATETINGTVKDINVTVTYQNNVAVPGNVVIDLLYGDVHYLSECVTFTGIAGEMITEIYTIKSVPVSSRNRIEARINYADRMDEINPDSNARALAPLDIPIPQNDFEVLFVEPQASITAGTPFIIKVAYRNNSYYAGEIPARIIINDAEFHERSITFSGVPFEVVVIDYLCTVGEEATNMPIRTDINWDDRMQEENPNNNTCTVYVDVSAG